MYAFLSSAVMYLVVRVSKVACILLEPKHLILVANFQIASPKDEPKLPVSFWGFTENAEVWNARSSMIGIFGIIIVEAVSSGNLHPFFTYWLFSGHL